MALPRGGVPVGYEVADSLKCPLDVLLVRKLGLPGQPELAMGAIAEGGIVIRNHDVIDLADVGKAEFDAVAAAEAQILGTHVSRFRDPHPPIAPAGHTVLIVDDGLATGSTALAGVAAMHHKGALEVWVCVPVAPQETVAKMAEVADRVVVLSTPRPFLAVGVWYRNFAQTSDEEVRSLLANSRLR